MNVREALVASGKIKPAKKELTSQERDAQHPETARTLAKLNAQIEARREKERAEKEALQAAAKKFVKNPMGERARARLVAQVKLAKKKKQEQAEQGRWTGEKKASKDNSFSKKK